MGFENHIFAFSFPNRITMDVWLRPIFAAIYFRFLSV